MADEEVDWGFDEQEDDWRGAGLAENDNAARADDDVISLEGAEDAEGAYSRANHPSSPTFCTTYSPIHPHPIQTPNVPLHPAESPTPTPTADSRLLAPHQKILQQDPDVAA